MGLLDAIRAAFSSTRRIELPTEYERIGIRVYKSHYHEERMEKIREFLRNYHDPLREPQQKLDEIHKLIDEIALLFGVPGDNDVFYRKYTAWTLLYEQYQSIKDLTGFAAPFMARMLLAGAKAVIEAAIKEWQIIPAEPIVIVQNWPGMMPPPERPPSIDLMEIAKRRREEAKEGGEA